MRHYLPQSLRSIFFDIFFQKNQRIFFKRTMILVLANHSSTHCTIFRPQCVNWYHKNSNGSFFLVTQQGKKSRFKVKSYILVRISNCSWSPQCSRSSTFDVVSSIKTKKKTDSYVTSIIILTLSCLNLQKSLSEIQTFVTMLQNEVC